MRRDLLVLPGGFPARDTATMNPGRQQVRIALMEPLERCLEAARRLRETALESGAAETPPTG